MITAGGGIQLHLVEAATPEDSQFVFIHGLSQLFARLVSTAEF